MCCAHSCVPTDGKETRSLGYHLSITILTILYDIRDNKLLLYIYILIRVR